MCRGLLSWCGEKGDAFFFFFFNLFPFLFYTIVFVSDFAVIFVPGMCFPLKMSISSNCWGPNVSSETHEGYHLYWL